MEEVVLKMGRVAQSFECCQIFQIIIIIYMVEKDDLTLLETDESMEMEAELDLIEDQLT